MSQYTTNCPHCGKKIELESFIEVGLNIFKKLKCGHTLIEQKVKEISIKDYINRVGNSPYPYQVEGYKFAEKSNFKCLIADEMGLGKTIQAILCLKFHPELYPALIVCQSSISIQWVIECLNWINDKGIENGDAIYPLHIANRATAKLSKVINNFQIRVISIDLLKLLPEDIYDEWNIKTLIIDECQLIKNPTSQRARICRKLSKKASHIIALSGTPIKNHAAEYFSILNILRPEIFHNYSSFVMSWCNYYSSGYGTKIGGLSRPEAFHEKTKDFIIRRERKDVLPDLPLINRQFFHTDLEAQVEKAYGQLYREFAEEYDREGFDGNSLAYFSRMRHLTGISKINFTVERVREFLENVDRKIVIFTHHLDVAEMLMMQLEKVCKELNINKPLHFLSSMDSSQRYEIIERFKDLGNRVMIMPYIQGVNLQFCSDAIMHERQWNPANEEQAEARFPRPGQLAEVINCQYHIAIGTIDEYFTELVEKKRSICKQVLNGEESKWDETSIMKELAEILRRKGGQRWGKK
jgi:SWI/SNF-related matrix-associated actin-dependent regulator 1 of chromatin subfamily A